MKKMLFLLPIFLLLIFVGCSSNKLTKYNKQIEKSIETVGVVSSKIEMKDSGVLIYEYLKVESVTEDKLNVKIDISSLDETFTFKKQSSTETVEDLNRNSFLPFKLKDDLLDDLMIENDTLTCTVSKENIGKLYALPDFDIDGNAELVLNFENEIIINITCVFKTTSGKDVIIHTEYSY